MKIKFPWRWLTFIVITSLMLYTIDWLFFVVSQPYEDIFVILAGVSSVVVFILYILYAVRFLSNQLKIK